MILPEGKRILITDYQAPFGGRGDSADGPREQGAYAKQFYTTIKTAYIAAGEPESYHDKLGAE